jgi:hypothetical protein
MQSYDQIYTQLPLEMYEALFYILQNVISLFIGEACISRPTAQQIKAVAHGH